MDREIDDFLGQVYRLDGNLQEATDLIFDVIDRFLADERADVCDEILRRVDVERLPTALMRSFLTITCASKGHLKEREGFFGRVERAMIHRRGPEVTKRLLGRLH